MKTLTDNGKKTIRAAFNVLTAVCTATGLLRFILMSNIAVTFAYFTIQSNFLCLIMSVITLVRVIRNSNPKEGKYIFFKGLTLVSILLTFAVYNFVLKPAINMAETLESALLHIAVPLMMLADFIFFEDKECFKKWHPFGWALFPVFYVAYTAVYKALGGTYGYFENTVRNFPYFFLDYETYGLPLVGLWVLLITIGFIGFSYLLLGFCSIFNKIKLNKSKDKQPASPQSQ
ncbi:MAG: Pr6Pr family membrane protein [Treponema sp.]|nr:Pr6Pr family membrane protein [Treponema sp.]